MEQNQKIEFFMVKSTHSYIFLCNASQYDVGDPQYTYLYICSTGTYILLLYSRSFIRLPRRFRDFYNYIIVYMYENGGWVIFLLQFKNDRVMFCRWYLLKGTVSRDFKNYLRVMLNVYFGSPLMLFKFVAAIQKAFSMFSIASCKI